MEKKTSKKHTDIHILEMRFYAPSRDPRHAVRVLDAIVQQGFAVKLWYEVSVNIDFAVSHDRE